jgi:hypothetical protein
MENASTNRDSRRGLSHASPVLPYQAGVDQIEARWGMPRWGQAAFGFIFAVVGLPLIAGVLMTWLFPGIMVLLALTFVIFQIHQKWKWAGLSLGVFLGLVFFIVMFGVLGWF